jgi:hypothetical protein
VPEGYEDSVPNLADCKTPLEAARLLPFEPFSPQAEGYAVTILEQWCDRNSSQAGHELRFVLTQLKWTLGWRSAGRSFLDQLPEG